MITSISIEGVRELETKLNKLPMNISKKIAMKALKAGAEPIKNMAKLMCPIATGELKKSIKVRVPRRKKRNEVSVIIGIDRIPMGGRMGGKVFYGAFVEFGTFKMAAQPFLRPAFDTQKEKAVESIKKELAAGIELATTKDIRGY